MPEQRRVYQIFNAKDVPDLLRQVNWQLAQLADRLDQLEGYRGTPTFRTAPVSLDPASESTELPTYGQLTAHTGDMDNPHDTTADQVGVDPTVAGGDDVQTALEELSRLSVDPSSVTQTYDWEDAYHRVIPTEDYPVGTLQQFIERLDARKVGHDEGPFNHRWEQAYDAAIPDVTPRGLQSTGESSQAVVEEMLKRLSLLTQPYTYDWELQYADQFLPAAGTYAVAQEWRQWKKYTAVSPVTLDAGTTASTAADLQTFADGNSYSIAEVAATPGIDLIVDFVGVSGFWWVHIVGVYEGQASHAVSIQLHNWSTDGWDTFGSMHTKGVDIKEDLSFTVPNPWTYIGTGANVGKVRVRFNHTMNGSSAHDMHLDVVALYQ